jgi:hypothetical protein
MRSALIILLALMATSVAQDAVATKATPAEVDAQRSAWGLSEEQYSLVHPSRRPGGDTYEYWKNRGRGPYGNLLERIPGGPRRPVKI